MTGFFISDPRFEMPSLFEQGRKPVGKVEIDRSNMFGQHCDFLTVDGLGLDLIAGEVPTNAGTKPSIIRNSIDITTSGSSSEAYNYTSGKKFTGTSTSTPHTWVSVFKIYGTTSFGTILSTSSGNQGHRLAWNSSRKLQLAKGGVQALTILTGDLVIGDLYQLALTQIGQSITGYLKNATSSEIFLLSGTYSNSTVLAGNGIYEIGRGNGFSSPAIIDLTALAELAAPEPLLRSLVDDPYQMLIPA
jgi:hypothetical protein